MNVTDMAGRRANLLGGPAAAQSMVDQAAMLTLITEAHASTAEMAQALRATIKDLNAQARAEEEQDDARYDALLAKIDTLNAKLAAESLARGTAEGECVALRAANADLKAALAAESQRAITIQMPPETESAPVGYTMRVVRDGANQIRDMKLIPEEGSKCMSR